MKMFCVTLIEDVERGCEVYAATQCVAVCAENAKEAEGKIRQNPLLNSYRAIGGEMTIEVEASTPPIELLSMFKVPVIP